MILRFALNLLTGLLLMCVISIVVMLLLGPVVGGDVVSAATTTDRQTAAFILVDLNTEVTLQTSPGLFAIQEIKLSPDGRRALIYSASRNFQTQLFYIYDVAEQRILQRIDRPGDEDGDFYVPRLYDDFMAVWSPDSRKIGFRDPGGGGLYVIDLEAKRTQHIYDAGMAYLRENAWSPDSQYLTFVASGHVFLLDSVSGELHTLSAELNNAYTPNWSPDSRRMAFVEINEETRTLYTYILDAPDGRLQNLSDTVGEGYMPQWSPDGEWLAFFSGRIGGREGYTIHLESGAIYQLDEGLDDVDILTWSPNSERVALEIQREGSVVQGMIYLAEPRGGEPHLVTEDGVLPQWSPDGTRLIYQANQLRRRSRNRLYLVDLNQDLTPTVVTDYGLHPTWSPGGENLLFMRRAWGGVSQLVSFDVTEKRERVLPLIENYVVDFAYWRED